MPALDHLSRVTDVSYTVARRAGSLALSALRQVASTVFDRRSQSRTPSTWARPPASSSPRSTEPREPAPTARPAPAPPGQTPADEEHVSREAVVVAESADPGAADGAGAQITIGEPWKGYAGLTAKEVNDRLAVAGPESLALARLYESANRNRVTVLREIDRRLAAET